MGNTLFSNKASRVGVLCPKQSYWPVPRPRSVGGLFRTFGRYVRCTCSQTLRRRVAKPHIQEGLRLGARASGAFRETVRLRTSDWRSGVGEKRVWRQQRMWSVRTRTTKDGVSSITMEKRRTINAEMGSTLHSVPLLRDVQRSQRIL